MSVEFTKKYCPEAVDLLNGVAQIAVEANTKQNLDDLYDEIMYKSLQLIDSKYVARFYKFKNDETAEVIEMDKLAEVWKETNGGRNFKNENKLSPEETFVKNIARIREDMKISKSLENNNTGIPDNWAVGFSLFEILDNCQANDWRLFLTKKRTANEIVDFMWHEQWNSFFEAESKNKKRTNKK